MTPEELDKARAEEAWRIWLRQPGILPEVVTIATRLAFEGWTPPEPVDPDVKLAMTIARSKHSELADVRAVEATAASVLAGIKAGREQEQKRAKVLVEPAEAIVNRAVHGTGSNDLRWPHILKAARRLEKGLTAYKAGKAAQ
jgi:hypothetical protein